MHGGAGSSGTFAGGGGELSNGGGGAGAWWWWCRMVDLTQVHLEYLELVVADEHSQEWVLLVVLVDLVLLSLDTLNNLHHLFDKNFILHGKMHSS